MWQGAYPYSGDPEGPEKLALAVQQILSLGRSKRQ